MGQEPVCTVPTNATLAFRFDRFLDPATVNRQAIRLYTGDPNFASGPPPFEVDYDPVERVVEYRMPRGYALAPHTLYQLELTVPEGVDDFGIRAFDGSPLAETELPLRWSFFTADEPMEPLPISAPTCDEIVRGVFVGGCAGSECHRGNSGDAQNELAAPQGLWLDAPRYVALTAINRIAHETELGDHAGGPPTERGARFGVSMALVDPRNPGGSYLIYKLLRRWQNFCPSEVVAGACAEEPNSAHPLVPLPEGQSLVPPSDELERLREWFVRGEPMPRPASDGSQRTLHLDDLRAISRFIAAGADCGQ